ncbi:hypothetical protein MBLNU230_g5417t1 [Neophaeotheca triangularis]
MAQDTSNALAASAPSPSNPSESNMTSMLPRGDALEALKAKETSVTLVESVSPERESLENAVPRTVDELIRLRARQLGNDEPIVAYPERATDYVDYSPQQLDRIVEKSALHYASTIPQRRQSDDPVEVVALLGPSDFSYLVSFLAVSRLGHSNLLLSTRITDEAHKSLLTTTKATTLLYHPSFEKTAQALTALLPSLKVIPICDVSTLPSANASLPRASLDPNRESHTISFIIHSSGSTGLPKPIFQTHKASLYAYSQNFGRVGHITLPLYHNHGICCLFRAIWARKKIYIYSASLPLTSSHLLATLKEHQEIKILYAVPYALKLLSETGEGIQLLSRLDIVMFGGSACPKPIGDRLVENGVNLVGHYGATELGQLMTSFRDHPADKGWDWLRVGDNLKPFLRMELQGPNLYELCITEGWPSKVATNRDDGSYATKDLFEPHPTIPDAWRYYARLDDTIVLENGEKANPLTAEGVLRQNEHVGEAVVFGANKPRLGAFIIPSETSLLADSELLDEVMPSVEEANRSAPSYAQLSRDMIKVLSRDIDYRRTDKGTVIRAAFYRDFAKPIDALYADEQSGSQVLAREELVDFLRKLFVDKLASDGQLPETTDLFSLGVDSLQAIQARGSIIKNLKVDVKQIGRNFIFDFPTLGEMADEILRIQSGGEKKDKLSVEQRMEAMINKHSVFLQHQPIDRPADGVYIAVTGATGSLGAHAVAKLASQYNVRRIYCLVRASSVEQANTRVRLSLQERRILSSLAPTALAKIHAFPSSFGDKQLGLQPAQYEQIACDLTHVLHLAWSVNFNKNLESFEADNIAGITNLANLCLSAKRPEPANLNFCSSVSATVRTPGGRVPEALPADLSYAQSMGYAQSKLVAEHLCAHAAQQTTMTTRVLRVGQIIGDSQHGVWNETEAIPLIFQSATSTGVLPALDETPSWLPVDLVANACNEIALSPAATGVMNIVNHGSFHWTRDLLPLLKQAGLEFEAVDQRQWVQKLRASNPDPAVNPSIKLVDFFAGKYDKEPVSNVGLKWATEKTRQVSPSLDAAGIIDAEMVKRIVNYLQSKWSAGVET